MTFSLLIGLALAFVVYVGKRLWAGHRSALSSLPGPWHSRYTNVVLRFYTLTGRRIFYIHDLHQRYGGVVRISPAEVAIADVSAIAQIHKIGSGFLKSAFYENVVGNAKPGIFALRDPHAHAARRKLFARAFSNSSLRSTWEGETRKKTELAVQRIKQDALSATKGADCLKWWTLMTTDIIAHLSFGDSFNMLAKGKQTPYIDALQTALVAGVLNSELPLVFRLLRYIPHKKIQQLVTFDGIIASHAQMAVRNMHSSNISTMNLFGQMMAAADKEEKASITDQDIREEAGNLIVAGSDTTAVTLTYLVWSVLKHPDLQVQLEEEVSQLSDSLSLTELDAAPILNSVIEETLRLYGAAPGSLPRVVPKQGMTVNGYHIPGGVEVNTQAYTSHRDPSLWPDPLKYDGLRFLNMPTLTPQQKAAYMPFGGGSRVCLGIHLAYIELRLATAMFFRECRGARLSDCMRDEMMEMDNRFLITPKGHCCYITLQ